MEFNNIEEICTELMNKAKSDKFLQHPVDAVEHEANKFVESFSTEHGMHSHTISPYRWYFQSENHLFKDGVVELECSSKFKKKEGSCTFNFIDVSDAKLTKAS